jgi:hypothetical protein
MDLGGGWETERVLKTNHIVGIGFLRRRRAKSDATDDARRP